MLPGPVVSSARAFERAGTLRLLARMTLACAAFECGMPLERVTRLYPGAPSPVATD